ncbi:fasciclin domain-containing protein [Ferruginibacter sp. SUN106]|uniref:fasciclin domain-containing protein n=1 Tax=Ferruginibacter sp. SUN106 TaxID=2978348 RepID=UPI003D368D78
MKKYLSIMVSAIVGLLIIFYTGSCKKIKYVESTTTDLNIYGYIKANPSKYSSITAIVDKSGYAGFLNAYGSYTMFVPTDSAVALYLTEVNKTLTGLTEKEAQDIVKFHLLEDTLTTASFKDGKLPTITMYGQYLVTGVENKSGTSAFLINRQGIVTQGNIKTGNGLIHQIDHVLKPAAKTVAELISADARFSIFKQALQATGYYDTINTINSTTPSLRRWFTVFAETNQALADSGITSFAALKAKYSNTGNPLNPLDSLSIYVKYHIIPDTKYLADIVSASSHTTLAPLEVLASKLDDVKVLLNDLDFNGVHEKGVEIERSTSDLSATTGVLHTALAHFAPKIRQPSAVYWDVADFPEVRKLPAVFRRGNFSFAYGAIKDITWDRTTNTMDYAYTTSSSINVYYGDYLSVPMGNTTRHNWIEFTTPIIIKGRYKVWICYRAAKGSGTVGLPGGSNMPVQPSFDGVDLSRQFNFCEQRPNLSDGELEALGWKKYSPSTTQFMTGKFLGIIDVPTTDRHKFRLRSLPAAGTGNPSDYLDMVHFIPINQNQYLPRFNTDGTLQYF